MASKTLKVSEVVYDTLENRKGKDESFDDVLRQELGLSPSLDDAAAYLPDGKRDLALDLVEEIDGIADFDNKTETDGAQAYYYFISPDSGLTIAWAEFSESTSGSRVSFRYRGMDGNMQYITTVDSGRSTDSEWELDIHDDYDELATNIREVVEGAVRKWA